MNKLFSLFSLTRRRPRPLQRLRGPERCSRLSRLEAFEEMLTSTEAVAVSAVDSFSLLLLLSPPSPEKLLSLEEVAAPLCAAATADAAADCSAVLAASAEALTFSLRPSASGGSEPATFEESSWFQRLSSLEQASTRSERLRFERGAFFCF